MTHPHLTVSDAVREASQILGHDIAPRVLSDLFYARVLDDDACPVVGGRRLIPRDYFPEVIRALRHRIPLGAGGGEGGRAA